MRVSALFPPQTQRWRVVGGDGCATPTEEDLATYLRVTALLESCGVHVPHVLAADTALGFALLEDLGNTHNAHRAPAWRPIAAGLYDAALAELARLQLAGDAASRALSPYDYATLVREMQLLPDWYCRRHLGFEPTTAEQAVAGTGLRLDRHARARTSRRCSCIVTTTSRNLMVMRERSPGVIDFQDALRGPVGYDPRFHPQGIATSTGRASASSSGWCSIAGDCWRQDRVAARWPVTPMRGSSPGWISSACSAI